MNKRVLTLLALVFAVLIAHAPSSQSGFVWDDDLLLTENTHVLSDDTLGEIWFKPGATDQYYPLVFTSFWIEHKIWGLNPVGYHVVNILLHTVTVVLLWYVLCRLEVQGAVFIALIFGVHPVHVESVGWIAERKNVLYGALYMASLLSFLIFHESSIRTKKQKRRDLQAEENPFKYYVLSLFFFIFAMLSKTVACSLPVIILLILWWKGALNYTKIKQTIPFFVIGLLLGIMTAVLERHVVGADGSGFSFSLIERCLIAGRALFFYVSKIIWPSELIFIYPRWNIDAGVLWQYSFVLIDAVIVWAAWFFRKRLGRGCLTALLIFIATLFPALGFINIYPMRFSFVADHFQYIASIAIIALLIGGCFSLARTVRLKQMLSLLMIVISFGLTFLTWKQAAAYESFETLFLDTIRKNPGCWMAYNNLAKSARARGDIDEAIRLFQKELKLEPDHHFAHHNLGDLYRSQGRYQEAIDSIKAALNLHPGFPSALNNLGIIYMDMNRYQDSMEQFKKSIDLAPGFTPAYNNMGNLMLKQGNVDQAIAFYSMALEIDPSYEDAKFNLQLALRRKSAQKI